MSNPELMMYRMAIGQILADAGINRETIREMVRSSIDEKVEKQMSTVLQQKLSNTRYDTEIRDAMKLAVRHNVQRAVDQMRIDISVPLAQCTNNELIAEASRRGMRIVYAEADKL